MRASSTATEPRSALLLNLRLSFPFKIAPEVPLSLPCNFRHGGHFAFTICSLCLVCYAPEGPEPPHTSTEDETDPSTKYQSIGLGNLCTAVTPGHTAPWRPRELWVRITLGHGVPLRSEATKAASDTGTSRWGLQTSVQGTAPHLSRKLIQQGSHLSQVLHSWSPVSGAGVLGDAACAPHPPQACCRDGQRHGCEGWDPRSGRISSCPFSCSSPYIFPRGWEGGDD